MSTADLRERIDRLGEEPDRMRRRMIALGVLTRRLERDGIVPVLVGGMALEIYTAGGYTTADVDLALPHGEATDRAFDDLGFRKEGRFWTRRELELVFEAPAPAGLPGETAPRTELEIEGFRLVVLGPEDLLIDRLRAAVHWKSAEDLRWAGRLAATLQDRLDWDYLEARVSGEETERAALAQLRESLA